MIQTQEEIVQFLKERSILRVLEERIIGGLLPLFEEITCGPGHVVFKQGDEADAIYIIVEGSVEVIDDRQPPRVLAYLTSGDCFGEMALLQDTQRTATVRVPEEAVLLKLPRKAFEELQAYFPEITREVTEVINRRLSGKLPLSTPGLQGNLAFFDLPTVIQTVSGSRQTGVLKLTGRASKPVAEIAVKQGKIVHASFLHLTGEFAIYELLARNESLDFVFDQRRELDPSIPTDRSIADKEPYKLLMEGARRADELPKIMRELGWPGGVPAPVSRQPDWTKIRSEDLAVARKIWLLVEVGLSVKQIADKLPYDRYTLLFTLKLMKERGILRGKYAVSEEIEAPSSVAPLVEALNMVSANLAPILGKDQTRNALVKSLVEASQSYPILASLKVHPDNATLDVRSAGPELSQSKQAKEAIRRLAQTFLRLSSELEPEG